MATQYDTHFVQYDASGAILAAGTMALPVLQAQIDGGELLLAVDVLPPLDGSMIVQDGAVVPKPARA